MARHVPESAIDYLAIFDRGGKNLGDEDFALFKCPACNRVYLLDYEVDTIYLDGNDLSKREEIGDAAYPFTCVGCGHPLPSEPWIGPNANERFLVTWEELAASAWSWAAKPSRDFGDDV